MADERDINTDFLLVLLCDMLNAYSQLKVILMSATIDVTLFRQYFFNCSIVEIEGRTFGVREYFLEDMIQLLNFQPMNSLTSRKQNNKNRQLQDDDDDLGYEDSQADDIEDVNCNAICGKEYSRQTAAAMSQLSEKSLSFQLIEALISYICSLSDDGAILIFLPGWNLIQALLKYFQQHPRFSKLFTLPSAPQTPSTKLKRSQSMNTNRQEIPVGQSVASVTRPSPGFMVTFDTPEEFTNHDIEELNIQLEKKLLPTDSGSHLSR
ncbi:unnamed protein product [Rotaria sordida]|uniref:Uncharacterized protein n=1 Tax=Rotaria sordida TaxID=392033 RepID=A0A814FYG6_9BILA|nr:unnamed protein product [Rotaria sordida]CAF1201021.1 unnamed protein product [Rotaria sordida]